ncbi:DUF2093 domain-containing protein [Marinibaculum pumilum]|uniref:DUF2093 domain-containing protein n=1 Tax=Marinibaculum pumilum TaxID=1766165 RepID=A0ABV7KVM7_9PROT
MFGSKEPLGGEARVVYRDAAFDVIAPGSFVTCAVTGQRIPLADLKYWSVDRQEAYATPDAATQAFTKADYSEG